MSTILLSPTHSYEQSLQRSYKVNWQIEDIIGGDKQLDFTRRFLPEALARVNQITCLNEAEKLILNQIRSKSYLHLFGVIEEFIVPAVLDHVQTIGLDDITAIQSLLHFAEEESKHIRLFRRFEAAFDAGFGSRCEGIGPAATIANGVLQHHPLGVLLIVLYVEWMTQYHYLAIVRDNSNEILDRQFCSLLRHHWLEEAQHTTLDTLMLAGLVGKLQPDEVAVGVADFFKILEFLDMGLQQQVQLDLTSLAEATGRCFTQVEQQEIRSIQERSYYWTFIGSGISHSKFTQTFSQISPNAQAQLKPVTEKYTYL
jgi:hypothetical protein